MSEAAKRTRPRPGRSAWMVMVALACSDDGTGPAPGPGSWVQVAAGDSHACALTEAGAVYCWGNTGNGQAGQQAGPVTRPQRVQSDAHFVDIAAGGHTTCGITDDGALLCWGQGLLGQLGNGEGMNAYLPGAVAGGLEWKDVSVGTYHVCGIDTQDRLHCWGGDRWDVALAYPGPAQCAAPAFEATWPCSHRPLPDFSPGTFAWVEAGLYQTCAGSSAEGVLCWGVNDAGQLGTDTEQICRTNDAAHPVERPCSRAPISPEGPSLASARPGTTHGCGLDAEGRAYCWGGVILNLGQVGDGTLEGAPTPIPVAAERRWLDVYTSHEAHIRTFSCGIDVEGEAFCWGANRFGQLGSGLSPACGPSDAPCRMAPTRVVGDHRFTGLALGTEFACGVTVEGVVLCWGTNDHGQLGDGTLAGRSEPAPIGD